MVFNEVKFDSMWGSQCGCGGGSGAPTQKDRRRKKSKKKKKMLSLNAIDNPRESFWTKYTPGVALVSNRQLYQRALIGATQRKDLLIGDWSVRECRE